MNVHSKSSKQRILDATLALIAEKGLHNAPMAEISERSQVSAGAIYNHFPNKEALINDLYLNLNKTMVEAVFEKDNDSLRYKKRFFELWKRFLDYFLSHPQQFSVIEQYSISPLIASGTREVSRQYFAPLVEFLSEGVESGLLKNINVELMFSLFWGSMVGVVKLNVARELNISAKQREIAACFCWDGLKAK